jgi:integrase
MKPMSSFATILTRFFSQRLMQQRHASPHTIESYRDTFRLLLQFAKARLGKEPSQLAWEDVDATLICTFLNDLEERRRIGARSRNLRLTAIRSFFRYAAFEIPAQSDPIQRILAIPSKRCTHEQVHYLTRPEIDSLLAAPAQNRWSGRRDHAWLLLAVQTGLRLSELTGLTCQDVRLGKGAHVHVVGKGRKERPPRCLGWPVTTPPLSCPRRRPTSSRFLVRLKGAFLRPGRQPPRRPRAAAVNDGRKATALARRAASLTATSAAPGWTRTGRVRRTRRCVTPPCCSRLWGWLSPGP